MATLDGCMMATQHGLSGWLIMAQLTSVVSRSLNWEIPPHLTSVWRNAAEAECLYLTHRIFAALRQAENR